MVAYVIVPGIGGSGEEHWQTVWEREWGDAAVRIAPRSWDEPDLPDWVDSVERAVDSAEARDSDVVLIAHSLGCWAVSTWLNTARGRDVRGVLLVAPPDPAGSAFPADAAPSFLGVEARTLACPSMVVASTNDPYCSVSVAEGLAAAWGSHFEVAGAHGHLNTASGLGGWPQGRQLLEVLVSS